METPVGVMTLGKIKKFILNEAGSFQNMFTFSLKCFKTFHFISVDGKMINQLQAHMSSRLPILVKSNFFVSTRF